MLKEVLEAEGKWYEISPRVKVAVDAPLQTLKTNVQKDQAYKEFPGDPLVRTPCFHRQGPGFDPWLGN